VYLVALIVVLLATTVATQTPKPDVLQDAVKETAEKTRLRPGVVVKNNFRTEPCYSNPYFRMRM
jgi:hypothetical protein